MALSRGVPKREKPRNEARSADYTGKVAVPPPLLSFFLKYAPPTFSTSSTFRAARERCVCVCVYACQGQDPVEENEGKKFPPLPRIENACFLSMIHGTRLPMFITNLSLSPKTNESRIQNRFQIYARHNTCATPSHRIAVCYWRNWGSVFVRPACRSNDSFVSPSPLPPPGGHCFFGLSTKLISRWQRVLLRFLPR